MKKILSALCLASALLPAFSCKKIVPPSLDVQPVELTWDWDSTSPKEVTVSANYQWIAVVSDESVWAVNCEEGSNVISINPLGENYSEEDLTATVTVICLTAVKTIALTQKSAPGSLEATPENLVWERTDTGAKNVTVVSNFNWTAKVSDEAAWTIASEGENLSIAPKAVNDSETARTATVTITCKDVEKTVSLSQKGIILVNGYECVDLGLSVMWAACNMGAASPEDCGSYYGWGMTEPYGPTVSYEAYFRSIGGTGTQEEDCGTEKDPLKEYVYNGAYSNLATSAGTPDCIGATRCDAARQNWKGEWRLPTWKEFEELKNKCNWTWIADNNGVSGYRITSRTTGSSIFLPAAGYINSSGFQDKNNTGYYSSSTRFDTQKYRCTSPMFISNYVQIDNGTYRYWGQPIRPVIKIEK